MIRKPPANWQPLNEGAAVRTVRTAAAVATGGARVARRAKHVALGLISCFFAALWASVGLADGLATGNLPTLIGVGAMVAVVLWVARRAFAKARET
jgi:hypothetical protein